MAGVDLGHHLGYLGCASGRRVGQAGLVAPATCPDWRWLLGRDDSPWYPTARLFRQPEIGDWDSVIRRS